jgi:hypothetical protein
MHYMGKMQSFNVKACGTYRNQCSLESHNKQTVQECGTKIGAKFAIVPSTKNVQMVTGSM